MNRGKSETLHVDDQGPSTSGTPPVKRKRYGLAEKMTEEELQDMIEAMSYEEDFSDESDSEFVVVESEETEESDKEDLDSETTREGHSSSAFTSASVTVRDPKTWEVDQPLLPLIPFTGSVGLKVPLEGISPRSFFDLVVNKRVFDLVVTETNRQAEELYSKNISPCARISGWKPLHNEEFEVFLGLLYHMGTIRTNCLNDYWKKTRLFNLQCVSSHMRRDRFLGILQALHFAKNPEEDDPIPDGKLYKIRPLLDIFHKNMSNIESPPKELSLDESMVLWRGHLVFHQYIKNKCHKYGIKLYMLMEPSGLVLKLLVYAGSSDKEVGGQGHVSKVVNKLLDDRTGVGHSVFLDSFYTSVPLAEELLDNKIYCTGTLRPNRKGNPTEVSTKILTKGEVIHRWNDKGVCVLKWKDKRDVMMISTEFGPKMVEASNRRGRVRQKLEAVAKYNQFMGGIDHCDQLMAYYPCERKSLKWYRKLGIHIFQLMLLNIYLLYQKYSGQKKSLYDFRLEVIDSLLPITPGQGSRPSTPKAIDSHFPDLLEVEGARRKQKRSCMCYDKGITKKVTTCCPEVPGLCLRPCFRDFHKKLEKGEIESN